MLATKPILLIPPKITKDTIRDSIIPNVKSLTNLSPYKKLSFKITELAKVIFKECKFKIIGIRPGEKIHEVLISKEESNFTKEFKDNYVIYPIILDKKILTNKDKFLNQEYSSKNNKNFLNNRQIFAFLKKYNLI